MVHGAILTLLVTATSSDLHSPSDAELARRAIDQTIAGMNLKDRPELAWPLLEDALAAHEELRRRGAANAALYRNLGNLYYVTDRLPEAIFAYRRGLELDPTDVVLRENLSDARAEVGFSRESGFGRPPTDDRPPWLPRARVTNWMLLCLWIGYVLCLGLVTRWRMTKQRKWLLAGMLAFVPVCVAATLTALLEYHDRPDAEHPFVVIRTESAPSAPLLLRIGNGDAYPPSVATPLQRGMEGRLLYRRDDWVRIEINGGEPGWVPRDALLINGDD